VQEIEFDNPYRSHELISKEKWAEFIQDLPLLKKLDGFPVYRDRPWKTPKYLAPWDKRAINEATSESDALNQNFA
jgi:hypothetical protein